MNRISLALLFACLLPLCGCMEVQGIPIEPSAAPILTAVPTSTPSLSPSPPTETPAPTTTPSPTPTESPTPKPSQEPSSLPLEGISIGLDPGHQAHSNKTLEPMAPGSNEMKKCVSSGTQGRWSETPEYVVVLDVGLKLRDLLEEKGATVYMTRETHDVDIPNSERAKMMNDLQVDLVVRIHCDGNDDPEKHGSSMLVPANDCTKAINEESERAGEIIQEAFIEATELYDRGLKYRDDMSGFNYSTVPVVLTEMCYMTNEKEDALINTEEFQDKCAEGLCKGILNYFEQRSRS